MGPFVFLFFMALTISLTAVIFWKLPETKNKTFDEIAKMLNGKKMVSGKTNISLSDLDGNNIFQNT